MNKHLIPLWLREHFNSLNRLRLFIKRNLLIGVLIFIIISIFVAIILMFGQLNVFTKENNLSYSLNNTLIYVQIVYVYCLVKLVISMSYMFILFIWMVASYLLFLILWLITEALYNLIYKGSIKLSLRRLQYIKILNENISNRFNYVRFICMLIAGYVLQKINITKKPPKEIIDIFTFAVAIYIPIIYSFLWYQYTIIRKTRKTAITKKRFDKYLFSRETIHRKYLFIIDGLLIFAVFGWILFPFLFGQFSWIESRGVNHILSEMEAYKSKLFVLDNNSFNKSSIDTLNNNFKSLKELKNSFTIFGWDYYEFKKFFIPFQHGMFFILTFVLFCEIGIPSIINGLIYKEKRKVLLTVLFAAVKSTLLVVFLQIFIRKAYFIDISNAMGAGTIFMFAISFFLMQESIELGKNI